MSLKVISILLGGAALLGGAVAWIAPEKVRSRIERFPRSVVPAWILTAICCMLGTREVLMMNVGFLNAYKNYAFLIAPAVFLASVVYLKELLAPRALGGTLLLLAAPILRIARWHDSEWRLVVVSLVYVWIVCGIVLLLSPWWFRKSCERLCATDARVRALGAAKAGLGLALIVLGVLAY